MKVMSFADPLGGHAVQHFNEVDAKKLKWTSHAGLDMDDEYEKQQLKDTSRIRLASSPGNRYRKLMTGS